jgi:hypothetical protein
MSNNDLLSNLACVLTGKAQELCDSLDQPTPAEISAIRLARETPAA